VRRNEYDQFIRVDTSEAVTIHLGGGSAPVTYLGDLLMIDFDHDGAWEHSTAIHTDNTTTGVLSWQDTLVYMSYPGVTTQSLGNVVQQGDSFTLRHF
jgi:hypothetical protein